MWDSNFVRQVYKTKMRNLETLIVNDTFRNYLMFSETPTFLFSIRKKNALKIKEKIFMGQLV